MRHAVYAAAALAAAFFLLAGPALAQDAVPFDVWGWLESQLPAWGVLVILGLVKGLEAVGKAIPDEEAGALAWVRRIAKFLTLYVPNREAR